LSRYGLVLVFLGVVLGLVGADVGAGLPGGAVLPGVGCC